MASYINTEVSGIQNARLYSYKELQLASDDFSAANKIGEGGFGSVYKVSAQLCDFGKIY